MLPIPPVTSVTARDNENLHPSGGKSDAKDPVIQKGKGTGAISDPINSFDGVCLPFGPPCAQGSTCSCLPPDTNGEVGATQYVQMVNSNFAVYSKAGAVLRGSTPINELWAGTNSECANHNDGDPVVVYDQLANRWVLSQFIAQAGTDEEYGQCFAVSTTSSATGSYYLYEFHFGKTFHDYPKLGVWPDAYYMSANQFSLSTQAWRGTGAVAYERAKLQRFALNAATGRAAVCVKVELAGVVQSAWKFHTRS